MSQQLVKKGANGGMVNVNPKSWIEAIKDKNTGQTLVEILQGFNMYFLPYNGNTSSTRCLVPTMLRKKGLWVTYVKYDGNVYTEWYAADEIDDKSWGDSSNWRIGNNTLVGDITISANGNWVINGTETGFKAVGEKGNTPLLRVINNRLQVSYDLGDTYRDITNNPIYTKFRWLATSEDTQANNVGRIQASTDEGKTWTNMSNDFTNNLHIKKYIGVNESLPTSGIAEGTIYAKGPYYAEGDTLNDNPIYRLWVYAWKGNTLAWQDNGEFTSIAAGIVQETGNSETEVMSQKAVSTKLSELGSEIIPSIIDSPMINESLFDNASSDNCSIMDNYTMNADGTLENRNNWRVYEFTNTTLRTKAIYCHLNKSSDVNVYRNIELTDASGVVIYRGLVSGYKVILLAKNYRLRISVHYDFYNKVKVQNTSSDKSVFNDLNTTLSDIDKRIEPTLDEVLYTKNTSVIQGQQEDTSIVLKQGDVVKFSVDQTLYPDGQNIYYYFRYKGSNVLTGRVTNGLTLNMSSEIDTLRIYYDLAEDSVMLKVVKVAKLNSFAPKLIACWGDSLTEGYTDDSVNTSYPELLQTKLDAKLYRVVNCGKGGETTNSIAGRQGGIPFTFAEDFTLKTSSGQDGYVKIKCTNAFGKQVSIRGEKWINPCYVSGVKCTIIGNLDGSGFIKRMSNGAFPLKIKAGEQLLTNYGIIARHPEVLIIFMGQNGGYSSPEELVSQIRSMIEYSGTEKYLVISTHSAKDNLSQRQTEELALTQAFGNKYLNWRNFVVYNGLRALGLTPTTEDEQAISQGTCPPQLLTDSIHLTSEGYGLLADEVYKRLHSLNYLVD